MTINWHRVLNKAVEYVIRTALAVAVVFVTQRFGFDDSVGYFMAGAIMAVDGLSANVTRDARRGVA